MNVIKGVEPLFSKRARLLSFVVCLLITTFHIHADEFPSYFQTEIGPIWQTCRSNACGIEFGDEPGFLLLTEAGVGVDFHSVKFEAGPVLGLQVNPLHGRNTRTIHLSADGEALIAGTLLANVRMSHAFSKAFTAYIEGGVGIATVTTTFGGFDVPLAWRFGAGTSYAFGDSFSVGATIRYDATGPFSIESYHSDGLSGIAGMGRLKWRF